MKEKLTTTLSEGYKKELLQIALSAELEKIEYGEAIQYLVNDWREKNGKGKLDIQSK